MRGCYETNEEVGPGSVLLIVLMRPAWRGRHQARYTTTTGPQTVARNKPARARVELLRRMTAFRANSWLAALVLAASLLPPGVVTCDYVAKYWAQIGPRLEGLPTELLHWPGPT